MTAPQNYLFNRRVEPPDSLDDFPTPPWGTRALYRYVLPHLPFPAPLHTLKVWEPTANRGLMVETLREFHDDVWASDVFDYGCGYNVGSFLGCGADVAQYPGKPDILCFNPPFRLATLFAYRALERARVAVFLLARTAWFDSDERDQLFDAHPLTAFCPFMCRLPMHRARWEPDGSTTTAYSWFVWIKGYAPQPGPHVLKIPFRAEAECARAEDRIRFAHAIPQSAQEGLLL